MTITGASMVSLVTMSNNRLFEFPCPVIVFFRGREWVIPFEVMPSQFFGIAFKVTIRGANEPETQILAIWTFVHDSVGMGRVIM